VPCLSVSIARATKVASAPIAPERRGLRDLPQLRRRRVLALGEPVDAVVEQQDRDVDVPSQRVDQVVPADRERVAVAGDDPHREVGPRRGEAGRDRRSPSVDRVHAERLDVVREAGGAADPRDEDEVLAGHAELRQEGLDAREDRVVAAARAPAHLLVGLEVLGRQLHEAVAGAHGDPTIAAIASSSSRAPSGRPRTFVYETTSTRNSARSSIASCPRFISGTSTFG
jgi:hypothetical protein